MQEEIQTVKNQALGEMMEAKDLKELEDIRIRYLGRSGKLAQITKDIKNLKPDEKKEVGILLNQTKQTINTQLAEHKNKITESVRKWFDPTIPGEQIDVGHTHVITKAINEIADVFENIGFTRMRYPEVEWDWYAFGSLNFPDDHPARDEWETFFIDEKEDKKYGPMLLTPHTSSGQLREMERLGSPPIRMINIAKCYRRQSDSSHYPMFHQFEGLVIDEGISIAHLKGTLDHFAKSFLGPDRKTRIRPYHFQFTEPSFEVDVSCGICNGKGCKVCTEGWLEIGGSGMVHPQVLKNGGIDPKKYTGFAFGWGVERVYMMKPNVNIPDLRILYGSDLRFLRQF